MRKECDLSVTHCAQTGSAPLNALLRMGLNPQLSPSSFAENPVALLQMEPWYSDLGAKVTFDRAKCASLQKMYHKYLQLKFCMQYPAKKKRLLRRYMPWPVLIGSLGVFHEVPCSVPQSSIIDTASPTIPTVFPLKHLSEMPFASHCKLFLPMSSGEALSEGNHGINAFGETSTSNALPQPKFATWNLKMPKRSGDSKPLNIRDSSRWTSGGVYVMLIADLMLIASFATKVHPTTSRLLPNKLLWQHLGLPETIANGYPFHAEGCEKLLRRWTTVPSKNLQHLGSDWWHAHFGLVFLKWSFAVNRILKLDYLQSSKHLNMLQIWSISSNARNNY